MDRSGRKLDRPQRLAIDVLPPKRSWGYGKQVEPRSSAPLPIGAQRPSRVHAAQDYSLRRFSCYDRLMATTFDDKKIIYTMDRVTKRYGTRVVLKDIRLSYYYGAKIGVIGLNGSGKSSLLKILAGLDTEILGETTVAPGYTIGLLEQEPKIEAGKTVRQIVSEGVQEIVDQLAEFERIGEAYGDPDADFDKLAAKQAKLQEKLDANDGWNLDARLDLAMDALRCPPGRQGGGPSLGRRAQSRRALPPLLKKPDILLLDEPTDHLDAETVDWLERHLASTRAP